MRKHTESYYRRSFNSQDLEDISSNYHISHGGNSEQKARVTKTKIGYDNSDAWMEKSNAEMKAKYEAEMKKWQDPNKTELERIAYGIGQKYWKINDRINALEDYIKSGGAEKDLIKIGRNSQRANDVREKLGRLKEKERKKNNEYINSVCAEKNNHPYPAQYQNNRPIPFFEKFDTSSDRVVEKTMNGVSRGVDNYIMPLVSPVLDKVTSSINYVISPIKDAVKSQHLPNADISNIIIEDIINLGIVKIKNSIASAWSYINPFKRKRSSKKRERENVYPIKLFNKKYSLPQAANEFSA